MWQNRISLALVALLSTLNTWADNRENPAANAEPAPHPQAVSSRETPLPSNASVPTDGALRWMTPQTWVRDGTEPALALGEPGAWDDTHLLAPCVAHENDRYLLWYCGASGRVEDRVFKLGLATSPDGIRFARHSPSPVFALNDGNRSVLTPALLRDSDGRVCREQGLLRLWFAAADLTVPNGKHTLHETTSNDGIHWTHASPPELDHVYAPSVIKDNGQYRLWYVDVSREPWALRHARSNNGRDWQADEFPCLEIDQSWEEKRLFYPFVLKNDNIFVMWYGSYWAGHPQKTALGMAISHDGIVWHKNPHNPVFTPNPNNAWESHYTTSQSVLQLEDENWRMWYASRTAPPQVNKYLAIGTAHWQGPGEQNASSWTDRANALRGRMSEILTLPNVRTDLDAKTHRERRGNGYRIESITYASEPASRVTALLYLPDPSPAPAPAIIVACGHGGSKSCLYAQYAGQLYAKLGFACLVVDTIGEEERDAEGRMGSRAHDLYNLSPEERIVFMRNRLKRSILGKIVLDLQRGLDYLQSRPEVDPTRIGIVGYSLGGATAGCLAILDERVRAAVLCGWGFIPTLAAKGKECTRLPYEAFANIMASNEMTALLAPHCATLFLSGDSDTIIDPAEGGALLVRDIREGVASAKRLLENAGITPQIECSFVPGADHRPLFLTHDGIRWMQKNLMTDEERRPVPEQTVPFGDWADAQGQRIEKLYDTQPRERGNRVVDIGATYYRPQDLACFPGQQRPTPQYTFQGWVDTVLETAKPKS